MRTPTLCVLAAIAAAAAASTLSSFSTGLYSPQDPRVMPSCGSCHNAQPGASGGFPTMHVSLLPSARSLTPAQTLTVTVAATGGQTASTLGGFVADVTAGAFTAGTDTRTHVAGRGISHNRRSPRSWTFGYVAPSTPGAVDMAAVVNTVNANGIRDSGDMWAFHGFDSTSTTGTAVQLFVNAVGVAPFGEGCADGYGNYPVLGAKESPAVGNQAFAVEVHGAQPRSQIVLILGANPGFSKFDLGLAGATGCTLYVEPLAFFGARTGAGNAERAEGVAIAALPLPADASLRGGAFELQAAVLDGSTTRPLPLTMTNALSVTVQ